MTQASMGYQAALGHRDFRVLMARYVTSGIGSWAFVVALIAFVYEQTGSATWVAAVSICRLTPMFVFSTYAGVLAERFERTRVMLVSDLSALVCMLGLMVVALLELSPLVAIALASVASVATIMEEPAVAALVPQVVGEDDLAAANGLFSIVANLNVIVGPAIGAGLLALTSVAGTFALNAVSFAIAAILVTRLHARSTPTDVTDGGGAGLASQLTVGVRAIAQHPRVIILVAFGATSSFLWGMDTVLFPVLGTALGLATNGFGYLLTGLGLGGVLAGALVPRFAGRPRLATTVAVCLVLTSVPTALVVVLTDPGIAFGFQVFRGATILLVEVLTVTALQRALPPEMISRVFGAVITLEIVAMVAGAALAPLLLGTLGLDTTLLVVGGGIPLAVALTSPWWLRMDRVAVRQLAELTPRVDRLEALGIFAHASRPTLERLAAGAQDIAVPAGTVVVREDDIADALYVLIDGEVAVTTTSGSASAETDRAPGVDATAALAVLTAPSYFGEIGLLEQIPRTATVTTLGAVTLMRIDGATFLEALTASPASPAFAESARLRLAGARASGTTASTPPDGQDGAGGPDIADERPPTGDPVA
jgi:CRP-like cAMP-binding protein/predicted MFS family arabinose efflux permease